MIEIWTICSNCGARQLEYKTSPDFDPSIARKVIRGDDMKGNNLCHVCSKLWGNELNRINETYQRELTELQLRFKLPIPANINEG